MVIAFPTKESNLKIKHNDFSFFTSIKMLKIELTFLRQQTKYQNQVKREKSEIMLTFDGIP